MRSMTRKEDMLAMVNNDHEREVSTTSVDGRVNPRWLKVCKNKSKKENMRPEAQETLDLHAVHNNDEDKISITVDSGAAVSSMPKDMLPNVPERGAREPVLPSGQRRSTQSMNFRLADVTKSTGISEQNLPEEEQSRV